MDRGPQRAPDGIRTRPRGGHRSRRGGHQRWHVARTQGARQNEPGRLSDAARFRGGDHMVHARHAAGPYRLQAYHFDATVVASNKASYVAYRGPWEMADFTRERLLDLLARGL